MKSMTPERWQQVEDIFDLVVEAPDHERDRILTEACAGDDALRREVTTLLHAKDQSEEHFQTPPLLVAREALEVGELLDRDHVAPGDLIGPWRVVRLLGRGGMGAVYLAERADGAFDKSVALKIVKRGMDTDEIVQRFHHERRILARLEHRNIAGLLDGGRTPDGLPFFVMELASGEPIDRWCDEHTLTLRERLHLFQTVCEAVQYAHGNLVVHRDLKPGNIFVAEGAVKLLDFGIARLVGPAADAPPHVTQAYAARLTPQYASPEHLRGLPTSTATDVYSLGVILYELLCGRSPYRLEGKTLLEMEQTVCTEEPPRPSLAVTRTKDGPPADELARSRGLHGPQSLVHALSGDIDAICMKALSKDPAQRYVSAAALAEDIQRHLEGRPVRAHPPLRGYQFRKFVARNKLAVSLASFAATVLIAGTIVTAMMAERAAQERDLRIQEAELANAARDFVVATLGSFDPDASPGQRTFSARDIVRQGRVKLEELNVPPRLRGAFLNTLGEIAFNLGERASADSLFVEARVLLDQIRDSTDLAVSLMGLGEVRRRQSRYVEAADLFRSAFDIRQRLMPEGDRRIAESERALAFAYYNMEDAAADSVAERLYSTLLGRPDLPADLRAASVEGLADLRLRQRAFAEAESLYLRVLDARRQIQPEKHPDVARSLWGLSTARRRLGRFAEAEVGYRRGLDILIEAYGEDHQDVAFGYIFLGHALYEQKRLEEAEAAYMKAAETSERTNNPGHAYTALSWYYVGRTRQERANHPAAQHALRRAIEIYRINTGPDSVRAEVAGRMAMSSLLLGRSVLAENRPAEARTSLREAYTLFSDIARDSTHAAETATILAEVYTTLGLRDSASYFRSRSGT
jgi:serine/threonine-protein kinase